MAMSAEKRSNYALCGAKKKSGDKCRAFAGQGTDHLGIGRCKYHGGSTRSHKTNAVVQEAQRRMIKYGAAVQVEPHEALLAMLHLASGHVAWLRAEVAALDDLGQFESQVLVQLYGEERDRVARVAKACLDVGVAERQVQLAERYGEALAGTLRAVFADPELGLTPAQEARLPAVLRRHLLTAEREAGVPAALVA